MVVRKKKLIAEYSAVLLNQVLLEK